MNRLTWLEKCPLYDDWQRIYLQGLRINGINCWCSNPRLSYICHSELRADKQISDGYPRPQAREHFVAFLREFGLEGFLKRMMTCAEKNASRIIVSLSSSSFHTWFPFQGNDLQVKNDVQERNTCFVIQGTIISVPYQQKYTFSLR